MSDPIQRDRWIGQQGFTLMELMVASSVAVLVLVGAMAGLVHALQLWRAAGIRAELHLDLEKSMERMQDDLRLSSVGIGLMSFYPADGSAYSAISFPLSRPGTNGLLQRDVGGNIVWDTTVIYHVRPGSPDELIRSTFHPRNPAASPEDIYEQLVAVVQSTNTVALQNAALAGETASSRTIFRNLVDLAFRPPEMRFDGYAPQYEHGGTLNWGSIVLSNGVHELTFTVEHKNAASSGYKLGVDRMALSYSGSPREGEAVLPADSRPVAPYFRASVSGGSLVAQDMSSYGAAWQGRSQLTYTPDYATSGPSGSRLTFLV